GRIGRIVRSGGTVNVIGTLNNTGNNLTMSNTTGTWNLLGGTLSGGQLSYADGQTLALTASGGTLNNVQVNGDLNAGVTNAHVQIAGTTTFGTMHLAADATGVGFAPVYPLNTPVLLEGAAGSRRDVEMNGSAGTLN